MLFSAVNSLIQAGKQNKMARAINPVNTTYAESAADTKSFSPFIRSLYGEGKNLYQGRMVGANAAEQNIMTDEANAVATGQRNAGDASTLLAYAAGIHGQGQDQLSKLAVEEGRDKQNRFGVYSNVSRLMADEGQKVYEDKLRRYYDDLNYKRGLEGAAMQNKANFWGGLDDTIKAGISAFSPGGVLQGVLGGGGNSGGQTRVPYMMNNAPAQTVPYNIPRPGGQIGNRNTPNTYNRNVQIGG